MNRFILQWLSIFVVLIQSTTATAKTIPDDSSKAVILAYHRIGEDHLPDQSLTLEQFQRHIQEIKNADYNVLPLSRIIKSLQGGSALPPRSIAITLEGAYRSAIENAAPLLIKNSIPFTVFYSSDALDQEDPAYASWKELKALKQYSIVELALLPASYNHIAHQSKADALASLNRGRQRHREEFGQEARYLSYPYGEYSAALKTLAKSQGFTAAFGLHSGAAYAKSDFYTLPRFSMTEHYGNMERFRMVTNAYPLPVNDIEPADPYLKDNSFFTGFTIPAPLHDQIDELSCFISGEGKANIEILGNRIEIRSENDLSDRERIRLNCTMPGPASAEDERHWRWLGLLYHRAAEEAPAGIKPPQPDEPPELQE